MAREFENAEEELLYTRRLGYGDVAVQLDKLWHDIDDGKFGADAKTGTWFLAIKQVKDNNPKG
tara:strand:- start:2746 stop:2934 length:189 start_codon:yes stop_codon:yes gene_type:complete